MSERSKEFITMVIVAMVMAAIIKVTLLTAIPCHEGSPSLKIGNMLVAGCER